MSCKSKFQYSLLWFVFVVLITGCPPQIDLDQLQKTEEKVEEARTHVETVERMKNEYTEDFVIAQNELETAEENLQKQRMSEAYFAATRSIEASKRVLRQFYLDTVTTLVEKAKTEIETSTQTDPENPLKDFLPELDAMLAYADQIQHNPETVNLVTVIDYLSGATQITENINANTQLTLDADISFGKGEYVLSGEGKLALNRLIDKIIQTKENYLLQFPGKDITIKVKVVGHTDEVGFREGTELVKNLTRGFESLVPQEPTEKREFLNQRLSQFRAQTIGEYFQNLILQSVQANSQVYIEQDVVGKGEEIPMDVSPPYPRSDSRRRICKVYSYVIAR